MYNQYLIASTWVGNAINKEMVKNRDSFDACLHWRNSNYSVMHVRNKNSNIQGMSPNVEKVIFHNIRNYS